MNKIISALALSLIVLAPSCFAQEKIPLPPIRLPDISQKSQKPGQIDLLKLNIATENQAFLNRSWNAVKGDPIDNSLLLGMFSHHTSANRDKFNETNKLMGFDYEGYSIGTLNNSWHKQVYYAGIGRKIYRCSMPGNINFDVKYRVLAMHGYQEHYPDLLGITPIIMPMFGLAKDNIGTDFMIIPAKKPIFVVSFRVNLPDSKQSTKKN